jgi:hypothetical protein
MEDKRTIEEILEMLDESIKSGLYFEIRAEDSKTLSEYIEAQNKQLGIANTVNQMKQNNINALIIELEKSERIVDQLKTQLSQTKIEQLRQREVEIDLQIQEKINKLHRFQKTIDAIENEIEELNEQYEIIY